MDDMMHTENRNISYDDAINELIDVYQDRLALSGENAGGQGNLNCGGAYMADS